MFRPGGMARQSAVRLSGESEMSWGAQDLPHTVCCKERERERERERPVSPPLTQVHTTLHYSIESNKGVHNN